VISATGPNTLAVRSHSYSRSRFPREAFPTERSFESASTSSDSCGYLTICNRKLDMKIYERVLMNALLASTVYVAMPAEATETINLSYAAAAITGYDNCRALGDFGWRDADPYDVQNVTGCRVEFALPIPVGHLIRQISVSYGTICDQNQPCWNNTLQTAAYLEWNAISGAGGGTLFYWSSPDPVFPLGSLSAKPLMGKPDAFVTQAGMAYHLTVEVQNFDAVAGIQVTYD
jgi:hypothetical protein